MLEDLAGFSREELIELVGRLFGHIQVLKARIAELEGQPKPPTDAGKERKPASWVKANRPARSKGERRKRPHVSKFKINVRLSVQQKCPLLDL